MSIFTDASVHQLVGDEMDKTLPLPLHPRRAQQLFQEVLLTASESTPDVSTKSLSQRLLDLQRLNLSGIQAAKRGTRFQRIRAATSSNPHIESEDMLLQLAKDGSTLQAVAGAETVSIPLLDITGITLHSSPPQSFSLQLGRTRSDDNNVDEVPGWKDTDVFIAARSDVLNRWLVALTCGVNAFQQQQRSEASFPDSEAAELVWQAVRLRVFELAEVKPLQTALELVTQAIPTQELSQSEALRLRLQFLGSEG